MTALWFARRALALAVLVVLAPVWGLGLAFFHLGRALYCSAGPDRLPSEW